MSVPRGGLLARGLRAVLHVAVYLVSATLAGTALAICVPSDYPLLGGTEIQVGEDVEVNGSHRRIVRAAIAMARGLDIEVAADGVETITQLEFLRSCNCDLAQGFLISRPMQADKVSAILRSEIAGTRLLSRGMP